MEKLTFVPLSTHTLADCVDIARHAPDAWSREALQNAMTDENRWSFVALAAGRAVGFACFLAVHESADLEMIVVAPDARRSGVGRAMLTQALPTLREQGVRRVLLEVRAGNMPALGLYRRLGFKELALRAGMYANPKEDGILMAFALGGG